MGQVSCLNVITLTKVIYQINYFFLLLGKLIGYQQDGKACNIGSVSSL